MTKRKQKVTRGRSVWLVCAGLLLIGSVIAVLLRGNDVAILNPQGLVANEEFNLIAFTMAFMMIIAIPTLFILYFFAWKYRETNTKARFDPNHQNSKKFTAVLWALPTAFVIVLAAVMWSATHRLEPKKALASDKKPITIQVIAMRWKWVFIYPEQNIATVNYIQVPVDTPVQFDLTADETPMSSFWIPHLGGQLYAMTGHVNRLNLIADAAGDYPGSTAEINGKGFAGMKFTARASSQESFDSWVEQTRGSENILDAEEYKSLLSPSENNQQEVYASYDNSLYDKLLIKYGAHSTYGNESMHEEGVQH